VARRWAVASASIAPCAIASGGIRSNRCQEAGLQSVAEETHRPMWTCPRCGKSYVNRNNWHSCRVVDLEDLFRDRPNARRCFAALRAAIEADGGPVELSVGGSGVA